MSNESIVNYLKIEIKKLEREIKDCINEINLLEFNLKNNTESYLKKDDDKISFTEKKSYQKIIESEMTKIELLRKKTDMLISSLASKKANLNWIDNDKDFE